MSYAHKQLLDDPTIIEMAQYIADTGSTVRQASKKYYISKTTVHNYMVKVLPDLDKDLYDRVQAVFR